MVEPEESPVPRRAVLQQWVANLHERIEEGQCSAQELVAELAKVRRASRDLG